MTIPLKYNLGHLRVRGVAAGMTVLGLAAVTAIFVSLMAVGVGMERTLVGTGHPRTMIVVRARATESQSEVTKNQVHLVRELPGIEKDADGRPLASPELVLVTNHVKPNGRKANLAIRGVGEQALKVREGVRIVEGAWFKPQVGELIVGKGATSRFAQLKVGDRPVFHGRPWRVVGVFEAGGQAYESEVWGDVDELGQEWKRSYSSILIRVANASSIPGLAKAMDEDRQIQLEGKGLAEYYQDQNQGSMMLKAMGVMMGVVLAIGGVFGAANTMYAAVAARSKEIATMRVLGFSRAAIWFSFMLEAGALGIAGGVLGSAAAYLLVDGMTSGSVNWQTFTDLAFHFRVTPGLMAGGIVLSAIAAVAGGFFPAWRASRQGIAAALRGV